MTVLFSVSELVCFLRKALAAMELMQLKMLVAVVEEGSVHKAAKRVFRTAPAVSMALHKLEAEIGIPLFERSDPREHVVTEVGELLADYARRLLALRDEALATIQEIKEGRRGSLRIGTNESASLYLLPQLTQVFHARYPEVKVEVKCAHSDTLLVDLQQHRLNVVLVANCPPDPDFERHAITTDELVVIMNPKHPLASNAIVTLRELGSESIILEGDSSSLHERVVATFRRFHIPLNVPIESATIEAIKRMVERNVGTGIVPRMCVCEEAESGRLVVRCVEELREERTLWAVRRRNDECQASQKFMEVTKSLVKEMVPQPGQGTG